MQKWWNDWEGQILRLGQVYWPFSFLVYQECCFEFSVSTRISKGHITSLTPGPQSLAQVGFGTERVCSFDMYTKTNRRSLVKFAI